MRLSSIINCALPDVLFPIAFLLESPNFTVFSIFVGWAFFLLTLVAVIGLASLITKRGTDSALTQKACKIIAKRSTRGSIVYQSIWYTIMIGSIIVLGFPILAGAIFISAMLYYIFLFAIIEHVKETEEEEINAII